MKNAEISQSQFIANVRKENRPMMFVMLGLVILFGAFLAMETSFLFRLGLGINVVASLLCARASFLMAMGDDQVVLKEARRSHYLEMGLIGLGSCLMMTNVAVMVAMGYVFWTGMRDLRERQELARSFAA